MVPHPTVAKVEPKPTPKPRPVEKLKLDQLAKLMDETPTDTAPTPHPSPAKAKPAKTTSETSRFDPDGHLPPARQPRAVGAPLAGT